MNREITMFRPGMVVVILKKVLLISIICVPVWLITEQETFFADKIDKEETDEQIPAFVVMSNISIPDFKTTEKEMKRVKTKSFGTVSGGIGVLTKSALSHRPVREIQAENTDNMEARFLAGGSYKVVRKYRVRVVKSAFTDNSVFAKNISFNSNRPAETAQGNMWVSRPKAMYATSGPNKIFSNNVYDEEDPFEPGGGDDPNNGYNDAPVGDGNLILLVLLVIYTMAKVNLSLLKATKDKKSINKQEEILHK